LLRIIGREEVRRGWNYLVGNDKKGIFYNIYLNAPE